ncbi:MAG: hypothetical protein KF789_02430 [Bdellovibrionaceae bacterium]|nr:hypothetical protein [Pseudobdellovibrionaceae bacterium]
MEPVESASPSEKEKTKPPERVTLGLEEGQRVEAWLSQVNEFSKGYLTLSKSDIVNFLVRQHKELLTPKELQQIRADHYDPVRHITWITPQIKRALQNGDMSRVLELQEELRKVELSVGKSEPRQLKAPSGELNSARRKRKPKNESVPNETEQAVRLNEISDAQKSP